MAEIVPAIIAKDFEELKSKIRLVEPYVNWVQLDVMDGKFAPEKSWSYNSRHPELVSGSQEMLNQVQHDGGWLQELADIIRRSKLSFEAHLMIAEPEKEIDGWINSGVKRILVHVESTNALGETIKRITDAGLQVGVVLNLETPIDILGKICHCESADRRTKQSRGITARLLRRFAPRNDVGVIDVVQLMSIAKIGYHGHSFDGKVIPKIRALKEGCPGVKIAVDGGINKETAKMAIDAGADILVAGSAIFGSEDIGKTIKEFKKITNKQ